MAAIFALGLLALASAGEADGPWIKALSSEFLVLDVEQADLNGDGVLDTVVCYQDPPETVDRGGGIAIVAERGRRPLFHARFDRVWCEDVDAAKGKLSIVLKSRQPGKNSGRLEWIYGRDFGFPGHPAHPLSDVVITSSSMLDKPKLYVPQGAFDGNLDTTWAEGASGTGIGETLTLRFPEPIDIGVVGVFGGHGAGARIYADHNRIHRASFDARTDEDLGDASTGIDFSALGIDVIGDRVEYSVDDEDTVHFVRLDKRKVRELELRIDSVYLGNRYDDTHVAEIEIVPVLKLNQTLDKAEPLRKKKGVLTPNAPKFANDAKPPKDPTPATPDPLRALDESESDLIPEL